MAGAVGKKDDRKALARNKKARHDYDLDGSLEAGIVLTGSEVKSLRDGQASLVDAHVEARGGELWLVGAQIPPYPFAHGQNHEPRRNRKLLVHKREVRRLETKVREKGVSIIPLEIYAARGLIKVEIALGRGRREYEKRDAQRTKEAQREMDAARRPR